MQKEKLLTHLITLAEQLGLQVREEKGDFRGGLCKVDDANYIFLNRQHNTLQKIAVLTNVLNQQSLEGVFVLPAIRDLLNESKGSNTEPD